jgi:hypothetical protein
VPTRLETESADLARELREASEDAQRRAVESVVRRACAQFDPPLIIPDTDPALEALVEQFDAVGDEREAFRRARAATAAQFFRRGEYEESLYEALHAHAFVPDAIAEARSALLR